MRQKLLSILTFCVLFFQALRGSAATETLATGSYIINMGVVPQTVANGLKPYGLVYELLNTYQIPVKWVISPTKLKDGADFVYGGVSYKGGTFIIPAEFMNATIVSRISFYGVTGITTTSALTVDVTRTLTAAPRWTLDAANGPIAAAFLTAAGIPSSAYNYKAPSVLGGCDDVFAMPHADPTWSTHGNLYNWVLNDKGSIWAGCRAVSQMENLYDPAATSHQMNFLAVNVGSPGNALVNYALHGNATPPYTHQTPSSFGAQYMGISDGAHTNGAEQVYLPVLGGGWRPTTEIIAYDPTQANVPSLSPGAAGIIVYGKAFGNASLGSVMYEAGHNVGGTSTAQIAAQRAFFDFSFAAINDKAPAITSSTAASSINSLATGSFSVSASSPIGASFTYQWTSTCGGTFSAPTSASTTFTAPSVGVTTNCIISCLVTDACGRKVFKSNSVIINPGARSPIPVKDSITVACYTDSVTFNALANDTDPDADPISFAGFSPASGIVAGGQFYNRGSGNVTFIPEVGFAGTTSINYIINDGTVAPSATGDISISFGDPTHIPYAGSDLIVTRKNLISVRNDLKADDTDALGIANAIVTIPTPPVKGKVSVNLDGTVDYMPDLDVTGLDSFEYKITNAEGLSSKAMVNVTITTDGCATGQYQSSTGGTAVINSSMTNLQDTYVDSSARLNNFGTCTNLSIDRRGSEVSRSMLKFDVSGIPSSVTIDSAKLVLTMVSGTSYTSNQTVNVHAITSSWTEGTVCGASGTPSWSAKPTYSTTTLSSLSVGGVATYSFPISKSQVQAWVAGTSTNYGMLVKFSTETSSSASRNKDFYSKEFATVASRPKFLVSYTTAGTCASVPTRAPMANPDFAKTPNGSAVTFATATNDYDVAGTKTYSLLTSPSSGSASIDASTGDITYTPSGTFNGTVSVNYKVVNATTSLVDTATAYINVTNAPIDAQNDVAAADSSNATQTVNVKANDIDLEVTGGLVGATSGYTVSIYRAPKNGTATVNASGNVVYVPGLNFSGKDTLTYNITEPSAGCGVANSDTALLYLTTLNRKPVANNDTLNTPPCVAVTKNVVINDIDPDNNTLFVDPSIGLSPAGSGTATNNNDGTITFTPTMGFTGTAIITYTVTDNGEPTRTSNTASFIVNTVVAVNNAPYAGNDYGDTTNMDEFLIASVMDNDSDVDGNALNNPEIIGTPAHGTASVLTSGLIKYVPNPGFVGYDTVNYRISDIVNDPSTCSPSTGLYDTAKLFIYYINHNTVNAFNDEQSIVMGKTVSGNVITNDFDQQGDTILFKGFLNSSGTAYTTDSIIVSGIDTSGAVVANAGRIIINSNGTYTYRPTASFVGTMSVRYAIQDNNINPGYDTATLYIVVVPNQNHINTIIANNDENISYGAAVSGNVTLNDQDPQRNAFSVTGIQYDSDGDGVLESTGTLSSTITVAGVTTSGMITANAGTININSAGYYTFTPALDFHGEVHLQYTVCDTVTPPVCQSAVLQINVYPDLNAGGNDAPFAADDFRATVIDLPVSGSFAYNDADPNGDSLSFSSTAIARGGTKTAIGSAQATTEGGSVQFYTDGTYTYTPPVGYIGSDRIVYSICDITTVAPHPLCAQATIHFLVDSPVLAQVPPIANNITAPSLNNSDGAVLIPQLQASSLIKTAIASYNVLTLPSASSGVLKYCPSAPTTCIASALTAVSVGTPLTPAQAASLYFDPAATYMGIPTFTYNAVDANGLVSNTAQYSIPVTNNPPLTQNISVAQITNSSASTWLPRLTGADNDGNIVSYTLSSIPSSSSGVLTYCSDGTQPCTGTITTISSSVTLTPAQAATLRLDPDPSFTGSYSFNFLATDNNGNTSNVSSFTVPVVAVYGGNYPPVANNVMTQNISNNQAAVAIPNLNAADPDGSVTSYTIGSSLPNPSTEGTLYYCASATVPCPLASLTAVTAGQVLTPTQATRLYFDPVASFIGTASFTYVATDNVSATSNTSIYQIPVVNIAPVANPTILSAVPNNGGDQLLPQLSGSDIDGTVASYNILSVPLSTSGLLKYCAAAPSTCSASALTTISGTLTGLTAAQVASLYFEPAAGFTGTYTFTFSVVDNNNLVSNAATVDIPVVSNAIGFGQSPIAYSYNAAPVAANATANLSAALSATDPDGTVIRYTITSTVAANEGTLTYCTTPPSTGCGTAVTEGLLLTPAQAATLLFTPNLNYTGNATFTFTAKDNDGNTSNMATVTVPVVSAPPVAQNITNTAISRTAGPASLSSLTAADVDGSVVNYTILSIPSADQGVLSLCTTPPSTGCTPVTLGQVLTPAQINKLSFTPDTSVHSPVVAFTYMATDNSGNLSNPATFNIPFADAVPLPINLLTFTATKHNRNALIEWTTSLELAGMHYQLLHSMDGQTWTVLHSENAHGSAHFNQYSYLHTNVVNGTHYYKLKLIEADNSYTMSMVRSLLFDGVQTYSILIQPNPVSDMLYLSTTDASDIQSVILYSSDGKKVVELHDFHSGDKIDMSSYAAGIYMLKLQDANGLLQTLSITKK